MEEINLTFKKIITKISICQVNNNSTINDVNIFRSDEKKDSNIGIDLLINKSKSSNSSESPKS